MTSNKNTLKATEAFDLKLEVSGKGNLKLFKLPKPNLPNALGVYEPEHSEKVSTNLSGMRAAFQTRFTVVPNAQGQYPIPTVSFSYFDLENTKTYKTLTSNDLVVTVTDDPELSSNENSVTKKVQKTNVTTLSKQFSSFKSMAI